MEPDFFPDSPLRALLDSLLEMAALGERAKPIPISERHDEVDAIAYAFNVLLGELRFASLAKQQIEAASTEVELNRSKALRAAKDEAERANAAKTAFLRNISHELRTPLTILLASTEALKHPQISPEAREETTERIFRAGNVLLGLIDNVLDISKIEAGRIEYKHAPFRLGDMMNELVASFATQAEARGLDLVVDLPRGLPTLKSDPRRIRQILFNLVGNALKYTVTGGVRVEARLQGATGSALLFFAVSDTGPGIPEEEKEKLFLLFGRASDVAAIDGTGLGLYLSQKLAVGLGGTIDLAATESGRGSRFEVYIPVTLHVDLPLPVTRKPSPKKALQGFRLLVADDNDDIRGVFRALLELEGADIVEARDGIEVLQHAWASKFDVILMDVRMPKMTGLEAVRELRSAGYSGAVLALTADAVRELRDECLAAGYDDYVAKPIDIDNLIDILQKHRSMPPMRLLPE